MSRPSRAPHATVRLLGVLGALAALLLAAACAPAEDPAAGPTPTPTGPAADPTGEGTPEEEGTPDDPDRDAASSDPGTSPAGVGQLRGTLGGSDIEGGCVWLDAEDGTRYELVPAPDAEIRIDSGNLLVVDPAGDVVAEVGDEVVVEGQTDPGLMTFCQVGEPLVVTDVVQA